VTSGGSTLPELLISLTLVGILAAIVGSVLRRTGDAYRAQALTADRAQSLRVASAFLPAELRELDAADGDIVRMAATAVTIRAARQLAVLCRAPAPTGMPSGLILTLGESPRYGLRDFNPQTDSLWVLRDQDPTEDTDDEWVLGSIGPPAPDTCSDGQPGRRMTFVPAAGSPDSLAASITAGAPVIGFETLSYRLYRASEDGRWYVGQQAGAALQPVLGPVTRDGLAFTYLDASGAVAARPDQVRLIEVRVRAPTPEPLRDATGRLTTPVDSVVVTLALRNNRRF
jgi:prepilin-type N-terminal cleavage/methylation domain-containing protein